MATVLHDVNMEYATPQERHRIPTKVQPKRRAKSAIKDYSILLTQNGFHPATMSSKMDKTPSKIIADQLMKMGLEAEEEEGDENIAMEAPKGRRSTRRHGPYTPPIHERKVQTVSERRPNCTTSAKLNTPCRVQQTVRIARTEGKQMRSKRKVIMDGVKLELKRPIIKLKLIKQSSNAFREYRVARKDIPLKNELSATRRRSVRKQESSDEEYSKSESSGTESGSSAGESTSPTPPKRGRPSRVGSTKNQAKKLIFESPKKAVFNTTTATPRKNARKLDTLEAVRSRLHTSELPERLPCREVEFEQICTFVRQSIQDDALSRSMYISGVPGTGKTATVTQAIRHLQRSKDCPRFDFVMVNGMEVADPKQIFAEIYVQLFNVKKKIAATTAHRKLNGIFQYFDATRLPVVLLVDELDLLCTKRQEIVYDIFNWSSNEESRVSVLAIANTLDLPERLLSRRVGSRLGLNRLCFQPYDHDEIASIISDRLSGSSAVEEDAVELASRKIASVSGDLRKALDILRRAAQIAINGNHKQLTMKHVQEAVKEASTTPSVELIRSLSMHSLLILRAALAEQTSSGLDEFPFSDLLKQYRLQCHVQHLEPLPMSSAYRNAIEMCTMRLLASAPGVNDFSRRFRLGMTAYETKFALKHIDQSIL